MPNIFLTSDNYSLIHIEKIKTKICVTQFSRLLSNILSECADISTIFPFCI